MLIDYCPFEAKFSITLLLRAELRKMSPMMEELAMMSSCLLQATDVTAPKWDRSTFGTSFVVLFMSQILTRLSAPPPAI